MKGSGQDCQSYAESKTKYITVSKVSESMKITVPNECLFNNFLTIEVPVDVSENVSKPIWQIQLTR